MSTFGKVDVKQYTSKRVLVAVANHIRSVILFYQIFFASLSFDFYQYSILRVYINKSFATKILYKKNRTALYIEKTIAANLLRFEISEISLH